MKERGIGARLFHRRWPITTGCPIALLLGWLGVICTPGCAPAPDPSWTGFLHHAEGKPIASTPIRVTVIGELSSRHRDTSTSPFGEFELLIGPEDTRCSPRELRFDLWDEEEPSSLTGESPVGLWPAWVPPRQPAATATVTLPGGRPSGPVRLGDIRLESLPLLAQGRVVDDFGEPVEGAFLVPQFEDDEECLHMWTIMVRRPPSAERAVYLRRGEVWPPEGNWMAPEHRMAGLSAADGSFELFGVPESEVMRLEVSKNDLVVYETPRFVPGSEDVLAVLRHPGGLMGSIDGDREILKRGFGLDLVYPDDLEPEGTVTPLRSRVDARDDGTFDFGRVAAGVAELRLRANDEYGALLVIPGIEIPVDEFVQDPRLQSIDVSDHLRMRHLRIVDESGRRIREGRVQYPSGENGDTPRQHHFEDGVANLALRPGPKEMVITASGYLRRYFPAVDGDLTVVLEAGIPVVLTLPEGFGVPAPPLSLRASLTHAYARDYQTYPRMITTPFVGDLAEERGVFDAAGESHLIASAPGEYEVEFWIHHDLEDHYDRHEIPLEVGAELVVDKAAKSIRHAIEPEPAIYASKLPKLGE